MNCIFDVDYPLLLLLLLLPFFLPFPVAARNVVLTDDGAWVLLDYGMAKEMHVGQSGDIYYIQSGYTPIPVRWYVVTALILCLLT